MVPKKALHRVVRPVPRPLPHRRFVLFLALLQALRPRRKPAPLARVMAAPAVILRVMALAGPAATRPAMALADPAVSVPEALVAPAAHPVLLVAPVPVVLLAALGSRLRLPRPLTPATDRAKRSALRVAALLTSSRAILVAAAMMTTAVV